jgi:hypothetical protein
MKRPKNSFISQKDFPIRKGFAGALADGKLRRENETFSTLAATTIEFDRQNPLSHFFSKFFRHKKRESLR